MGTNNTTPFQPLDVPQISSRTDAHRPTLCRPHGSSLSTPDGNMRISGLSSGSSPSFSQHHRTPSSVSSFNLCTPGQDPLHLESCIQPSPYSTDHTSPQQRFAGILTSRQVAQNALRPSIQDTKSRCREIRQTPFGYVKLQKESPPHREAKRARRESKEVPKKLPGPSHNSTTQPLPAGTVIFTDPLTPTTVDERSFNTSSRKVNERTIARAGVKSEAGLSVAPKVQEKLRGSQAPTRAPTRTAEHIPIIDPVLSQQQRNSKEAKRGSRTPATRLRASNRSPPANPQNSTSQNTTTLPTLGKRQKRYTIDSNSSSNSSKTPTMRSRTNSPEDRKATPSSQRTSDTSNSCTQSVRKNSSQVGGETSGATSAVRGEPARQSPSQIPAPASKQQPFAQWRGRSNPVGWTLARPGSTRNELVSYREGSTHSRGYEIGWEAAAAYHADVKGPDEEKPPPPSSLTAHARDQNDSGDPERIHYIRCSAVDSESLMSRSASRDGDFQRKR